MASLLVFRRDAATELAAFVATSTTTAASDLVSFTCASLVSANAGGDQFHSSWAYLNATTGANLAAQRAVLNEGGYDNDAGSVTVARSFVTSVTSGMGVEILTKMPAITDELGNPGIREVINDVLLTIPPLDLLPVTGVTSQTAYDVTTLYPWLVDKSSIVGIHFQNAGEDYPHLTGIAWDWLYDADAPRLLLPSAPFSSGQTFYLQAHRPAQTWIKTGGTWGVDTDGLQNDTDEALPLRQVVRAQTLSTCYRLLGAMPGPDEYQSFYASRERFWTSKAYGLRWWTDQKTDKESEPAIRMAWPTGRLYGSGRSYR